MYCKKCGSQNPDGVRFCKKCGADMTLVAQGNEGQQSAQGQPTTQSRPSVANPSPSNQQKPTNAQKPPQKSNRKKIVVAVIAAVAVVVVGVAVFVLGFLVPRLTLTDEEYESAMKVYEKLDQAQTANDEIINLASEYFDEEGYVEPESVPKVLEVATQYAQSHMGQSVEKFEAYDDHVTIDFTTGITYMFVPAIRGMLNGGGLESLSIATAVEDSVEENKVTDEHIFLKTDLSETSSGLLVEADNNKYHNVIGSNLSTGQVGAANSKSGDDVTIGYLRSCFHENQLVLWDGHGSFDEKYGNVLSLSESATKWHNKLSKIRNGNTKRIDYLFNLPDYITYYFASRATEFYPPTVDADIVEGRVLVWGGDPTDGAGTPDPSAKNDLHYVITPEFIKHYYTSGSMKDSIFYFATCESLGKCDENGKELDGDKQLAEALREAGAKLVFGSVGSTSFTYQSAMRDVILYEMCENGASAKEALAAARRIHGEYDIPAGINGNMTQTEFYPATAEDAHIYGDDDLKKLQGANKPLLDQTALQECVTWAKLYQPRKVTVTEDAALTFISECYNDYYIEGGRPHENIHKDRHHKSYPYRILNWIEKDSDLYKKLEQSTCLEDAYPVQGAPSMSGAETIVAENGLKVRRVDPEHETFVVDMPYHIASPRIPGSQELPSYDAKDVRHGYWKVTFGKWGRVVALERANAEEFGEQQPQQSQQQPKPDLPNVGATLGEKPEKGLIYLPFDDDFKNRYDNTEGTAHANVPFGSGVLGNAAYFDGGEGYLDLGTGYNLSGDFTFNVWLKPDADNEGRNDAGVLAKYQTNGGGPYDFYLKNNAPAFWATNGSKSSWYVVDKKIPSDAWSMVTYMYNAANKTLNVYINGELSKSFSDVEASNTNNDLVTVGRQAYMFEGKTIDGGYNDSQAHLKYKGWMDDLLLLDYTLSESYIRQIYESGAGPSGNNPPSENPNPAPQQPEQPQQPAKDTANVSGTTWYYAHIAKSQMGGTATYRYGYSSLEFLSDGTVKMTGGNDLNLLGHDGPPEDFDWNSLTPFSWTGTWTTSEDGTITIDNVKGPLDVLASDPTRLRPTEQNGERVLRADEDTILTEGPGNLYSTFDRAKEAALASL